MALRANNPTEPDGTGGGLSILLTSSLTWYEKVCKGLCRQCLIPCWLDFNAEDQLLQSEFYLLSLFSLQLLYALPITSSENKKEALLLEQCLHYF
jgi:hypothetical protein